jgi:hypothetical protein
MPLTEDQMYDLGFRDGVKFVAFHVRAAADQVEHPVRDWFEKDGRKISGIVKTGRPAYANKLRELADEMERLITQ